MTPEAAQKMGIEPHILPLVTQLSACPGVKTWQSCEGHRRDDGSIASAHIWITPVLPAAALECLAAVPGVEEIAVLFGREERPIVEVILVGHWRRKFDGACRAVTAAWSQFSDSQHSIHRGEKDGV